MKPSTKLPIADSLSSLKYLRPEVGNQSRALSFGSRVVPAIGNVKSNVVSASEIKLEGLRSKKFLNFRETSCFLNYNC